MFRLFSYAPEHTVFDPTKYQQQLNYMIAEIITENADEKSIADSLDDSFTEELQNPGASAVDSAPSVPSTTLTTLRPKLTKHTFSSAYIFSCLLQLYGAVRCTFWHTQSKN